MEWDDSDTAIKTEYEESIIRKHALDIKSREERKFQQTINSLRMVERQVVEEVTIDSVLHQVNVSKFFQPKNFAGDDMQESYRTAQKTKLLANNQTRLDTLNDDQ